jgi:hypothetical protein
MKKRLFCRSGTGLCCLSFFFLFMLPTPGLYAQDFFEAAENTRLTSQQQHYLNTILDNPWTVDHKIIRINLAALQDEFIMVEIEGQRHQYTKRRVRVRDHDDYSWSGLLEGKHGRISIVVNGDMITGVVRVEKLLYSIYPLGEGLHVLATTQTSAYPQDCEGDGPKEVHSSGPDDPIQMTDPLPPGEAASDRSSLVAEDCRVRLLVAFTDDVADAYADPHGLVQGSLDDHNDANANSEVNHRVELARSMMVNYDESSDDNAVFIADFEGTSDGNMDEIHDDRALFDADMCVLLTLKGGGFCGFASGIGSTYSTAFCYSAAGCAIGNHTFAHEVGHLHGCRHDPYVDSNTEPYAFAHGYVYNTSTVRWRTIMAYNDQCDCSDEVFPCPPRDERDTPGEPECERQQNWSTPDVLLNGVPMGTEATHKNERLLDTEDDESAAFEAYIVNKTVYDSRVIQADEAFDIQGQQTVSTLVTQPFIMNNGSKGTIRAEEEIFLKEGFHAKNGSDIRVYLTEACDPLTLTGEDPEESVDRQESSLAPGENPSAAGLVRAFPNPFTQQATIELQFGEEITASIFVYDMFGRLVGTLALDNILSGGVLNQFVLDGANLPSGTYTCVIHTQEKDYSLRLIKADQ